MATTADYDLDKMISSVLNAWRDGMGCHWCGRNTQDRISGHDGLCPVPVLFVLRAELAHLRAKLERYEYYATIDLECAVAQRDKFEHLRTERDTLRAERDVLFSIAPEELGKVVRRAWVVFCVETGRIEPPDRIAPWEEIDEWSKEVDRRIGAAVRVALIGSLDTLPAPNATDDRLTVAERAARAMRHEAAMLVRRSTGREPRGIIAEHIEALDAAAIARCAEREKRSL